MSSKAVIVYDEWQELESIKDELEGIERVSYEEFMIHPDSFVENFERVLIHADTKDIKKIIETICSSDIAVAFLPKKEQTSLRDSFSLPSSLKENLQLALEGDSQKMDLLYGAGELVLYSAQIGDTPPFSFSTTAYDKRDFKERAVAFFEIFKKLKSLKKSIITLKTKKEATINTTATGIIIIEHDNKTFASRLIKDQLWANDAKLSALIISPSSLFGYISFLIKSLILKSVTTKLPKDIGLVESQELHIESEPPLEVRIDGESIGQTPQKFQIVPKALELVLPKSYWESKGGTVSEKETIKLNNLPTSKDAITYQQSHLPLFTHASEESYQTLFSSLREEAKASSSFITLIILSTLLATVGLYLDSSSVIIGAMLLAPLMQPIVSFSMGVLRRDKSLLSTASKSIAIGILLALIVSALFALIMPYENLTSQMHGRLKPTILDLLVALISGVAAAYAKDNPKIMGSLVGVSIAVALVPPIAVSGIGLGWGSFFMFGEAFLLFLTNLAGIVFAASATFMIKGFSPIKVAKRGLFFSLVGALIISIPLYISFKSIKEDANINSELSNKIFVIGDKEIRLKSINLYHRKDELHLKSDIFVKEPLNSYELVRFKKLIEESVGKELVLEVVQRVVI